MSLGLKAFLTQSCCNVLAAAELSIYLLCVWLDSRAERSGSAPAAVWMGSGGSGAALGRIFPQYAGSFRPSEFEGQSRSAPVSSLPSPSRLPPLRIRGGHDVLSMGGGGARARDRRATVQAEHTPELARQRQGSPGRPARRATGAGRAELPRARPWSAEPACDNPPRKISYYHLIIDPLWLLSNSKVSFCR
jgi:hypothetical protein